jgi:hypothetical protein
MFAEFYCLNNQSYGGITFEIKAFQVCGEVLRIQLLDGGWYFMTRDDEQDFVLCNRFFTDFAVRGILNREYSRFSQEEAADLMEAQ